VLGTGTIAPTTRLAIASIGRNSLEPGAVGVPRRRVYLETCPSLMRVTASPCRANSSGRRGFCGGRSGDRPLVRPRFDHTFVYTQVGSFTDAPFTVTVPLVGRVDWTHPLGDEIE
jgi:hypothetical protein